MFRTIIHVTEDRNAGGAEGVLANGEKVYMSVGARHHLSNISRQMSVAGLYVDAEIQPNQNEGRQPWFCRTINQEAGKDDFKTSKPRSIDDVVSGGAKTEAADADEEPDELDEAINDLLMPIRSFLPSVNKKAVADAAIDEGNDPTIPSFTQTVAKLVEVAEKEREDTARQYLAQLLRKGELPNLILDEAKRLVELGSETYWNGPTAKNAGKKEPPAVPDSTDALEDESPGATELLYAAAGTPLAIDT